MITTFHTNRQGIEDTVDKAIAEFKRYHSKEPHYLVLGRIAYEELRDMIMLGRPPEDHHTPHRFRGLEIAVLEEPANTLTIGCKPD